MESNGPFFLKRGKKGSVGLPINYLNLRERVIWFVAWGDLFQHVYSASAVATVQISEISPEEDDEIPVDNPLLVPDIIPATHATYSVCERIVWDLKVDQREDSSSV